MTLRRLILVVFILAIPCAWAGPVPEYDMKAAFLYNFASFTEWPEPISGNFNICIFENDPIAPSLMAIEGKPVKGARLAIIRITNIAQARQCHMLYLGESGHANIHRWLNEQAQLPILTVTDDNEPTGTGVMISMMLENKKLSFEVNYELARQAHLSMSSKMLRLAQRVR